MKVKYSGNIFKVAIRVEAVEQSDNSRTENKSTELEVNSKTKEGGTWTSGFHTVTKGAWNTGNSICMTDMSAALMNSVRPSFFNQVSLSQFLQLSRKKSSLLHHDF